MSRPSAPAAPPTPNAPADTGHRVTLVAFEGMQLLDLAGPLEVFAAANQLRATPTYDLRVATPGGGAVRTSSGLAHAETLNRAVVRRAGTTPAAYRQHFARRAV